MKKITLNRPKESFNKNCSYEILVGKKYLTDLKNGEEKTIEIPNEFKTESLKAKIQWCGSEKMELRNLTGNEKIVVSGNKFLNRKMPLFGAMFPLIGLMFFNLKIVPKNIGIGIFIIFLIAIVGTITIWRNKWLNIKTE
ncbi:hypothetical protein C9994_03780 [Marivirga lumbricoides]|uniref:Uncharacterized protein n=1 Tax=Marivirga lumbricoides TaxID=1046115 RepID=A0A2T4DTW1_9BACT|nr:hypothetical protein C9994_03780 [Marivirga lumbricoides]